MTSEDRADIRPAGILETVVYCDDLEAAGKFYEQVVGLVPYSVEPDRHLFYKVGNGMLLVFNPQNTSQTKVTIAGAMLPLHGAAGQSHFAFQVRQDQFESIRSNLDRHNVAIECELDWPGGGHSIYCRDPSGNSVEFATRRLWFSESAD